MTQSFMPHVSETVTYATNHSLQNLDLTIPQPLSAPNQGQIFIVYIHGGAWRDPNQSSTTLHAARTLLLSDAATRNQIAGIASLNYGLSPSPNSPSDDPSRRYRHPQHVQDIALALEWLRKHHQVGAENGWDYLLAGHSAGATLAYQVAAGLDQQKLHLTSGHVARIKRPRAILGIEGIYDLPMLVRHHSAVPIYREFVTSAFGPDERDWCAASPAFLGEQLQRFLQKGNMAVIAHSPEDELVEQDQADCMLAALKEASNSKDGNDVVSMTLYGKHDQIWQDGNALYDAIVATMRMVFAASGT